jgi:acetyl esterase/lipase
MARAPRDVVVVTDERYGDEPEELLDVYGPRPAVDAGPSGSARPTVVWTHGGGFIGGSKEEPAGYLRRIAQAGFTVVGVGYTLAPGARYPTPARQLMAALAHLQADAGRLGIDPTRLVLAGDSAGAHVSAQVAAIVTNPSYSRDMGIAPTIEAEQLRGVALCCGLYDLAAINRSPPPDGPLDSFIKAVAWNYSGNRHFRRDAHFLSTMSVAGHVTAAFPPAFVTAGNADLLQGQSRALAARLEAEGVDVETLFFASDHEPPLPHEYQFDLDGADGQLALERLVAFFGRCTASPDDGATDR